MYADSGMDGMVALASIYVPLDVFPSLNVAHHLAISDINNHNVVVGWKNGQMRVTETDIVTNHCLAETHESPLTGESVKRFAMLSERYAGLRCLLSRRTLQQTYTLTADGMNRCHSVLNSIPLQSSETLSILRRSIPEGV